MTSAQALPKEDERFGPVTSFSAAEILGGLILDVSCLRQTQWGTKDCPKDKIPGSFMSRGGKEAAGNGKGGHTDLGRKSEYRSRKETLNKWKISLIPSTHSGSFSFQLTFSELRLMYM